MIFKCDWRLGDQYSMNYINIIINGGFQGTTGCNDWPQTNRCMYSGILHTTECFNTTFIYDVYCIDDV